MRKNLYILLSSIIALLVSQSSYAQPLFTAGHTASLTVCQNSPTPINSLLSVSDGHTGTTDNWTLKAAAAHGTASVTYSTTSTGGTLVPIGTTYTPTIGYTGNDSFKVYVSDGTTTDSITAYVKVVAPPTTIIGPSTVCGGYIISLTDATGGGTWSSSNTGVATVSSAGFVTGQLAGGTATISYQVSLGCAAMKTVTVYPASPITGTPVMCPGDAIILADAIGGGTWSSSNTSVATTSGSTVFGVSAGTAFITYTYTSGCISFVTATVNPLPAPISVLPQVCIGGTTTLSDATPGGTWTSDNTANATIDTFTGFVSGIAVGTANISYTLIATGCVISVPFTVNALPTQYTISGGGNYCSADTGVHVLLGMSDLGTSYFLHVGTTTFGPFLGTGGLLDFGLQTIAGTYTAFATKTSTGCSNIMTGSVAVTVTPSVPVSIMISSDVGDSICVGTNVNFTGTTVNPGTVPVYQWRVNGVNVGVDAPAYTYTPAAGDVVTVFLATDTACAMADTVRDTYNVDLIPKGVPSVTVTEAPGLTVCKGSAVTLTPVPYLGGYGPSYVYYSGGVPVGTGSKFAYVPSDSEEIVVALISNYFCRAADTALTSVILRVEEPQLPYFTVDAYPEVLTAPGQTEMLTVNITNVTGPFSYQWVVNDSVIAGATSDTFTYSNFNYMGNDSVTCEVTRNSACRLNTFNWRKMVNNVGVKNITAAEMVINVSPNPGNGNFTIKGILGADENATIEITNMMGQVAYSKKANAPHGILNEQINLNNQLANGMYLLNVRSASGSKVFHIVIE